MLRTTFIAALFACCLPRTVLGVANLRSASFTALGLDPKTVNRLNGESFQQDAIATSNGYQYAVAWAASLTNASVRHATVSRRPLHTPRGGARSWESLILSDYNQTEDDGHDMSGLACKL